DLQPTGRLRPAPGTKVIEAQGLLAIPGLINTHAHVPMVLFRGLAEDVPIKAWFNEYIWPLESNLTPEDVYWGALLGLAEMIEAGITSVADHYFFMDEVARAVADAGMRANLVWAVFGHQGEAKLDETVAFVQRWQGAADGRITTWLGPHAPYTTGPEFLRLVAARAQRLGVGIHIHVSETAEQVQRSLEQYGVTPIQMLAETGVLDVPTILAHVLYPTDEDIQRLQRANTGIAHAPKTYLKLGMGTAPLAKFRAAGIPVGLATDGAVSSNTLDILEQMRLMALTQKDAARDPTVMPVPEVLHIAFQGSAQVMQMGDRLGQLAPGKLADITLLRQDGLHTFPRFDAAANLVYSARAGDVHTVICNGQVLLEDGRLLTIDKERVKYEVAARLKRLSRRVPENRIATYLS
ncbi:MAG: amidohydrolase, partial [Chloroflexi bacterium]|nr:amidohydrolase [Chloroflexota bacterium]